MEIKHRLVSSKPRALAAGAAIIAIGAGAFMGFKKYRSAKDDAGPSLVKAAKGDIEVHFSDSGELAPKQSLDIAPKVSGRVIEFPVQEGRHVRRGDRLAVIQPGRTEAEHYVPFVVASPIDGVVMRYQKEGFNQDESRIAKLGDYVTGLIESNSPTYLMTLADPSRLIVKMKISEMDILKLKENMAVSVTVDALPGTTFPARVSLISPKADKDNNNLKSFKVEVFLIRNDPRLKPGMTARVDGLLESRKGVLKIPISAVFEEAGSEVVYVNNLRSKPQRTIVKLGLRNETDVEVLSGVSEGQELKTEKPAEETKS